MISSLKEELKNLHVQRFNELKTTKEVQSDNIIDSLSQK